MGEAIDMSNFHIRRLDQERNGPTHNIKLHRFFSDPGYRFHLHNFRDIDCYCNGKQGQHNKAKIISIPKSILVYINITIIEMPPNDEGREQKNHQGVFIQLVPVSGIEKTDDEKKSPRGRVLKIGMYNRYELSKHPRGTSTTQYMYKHSDVGVQYAIIFTKYNESRNQRGAFPINSPLLQSREIDSMMYCQGNTLWTKSCSGQAILLPTINQNINGTSNRLKHFMAYPALDKLASV